MTMKPYDYKKILGKTKHELRRIKNAPYPFSSNIASIKEGKKVDAEYRKICEKEDRIYVNGYQVTLTYNDGSTKEAWKIGYCRDKRKQ